MNNQSIFQHCPEILLNLPESGQRLLELTTIQCLAAIIVHSIEDDLQRPDTNATSLLDSELELEIQFTDHNVHVNTVVGHSIKKLLISL